MRELWQNERRGEESGVALKRRADVSTKFKTILLLIDVLGD
jgi:hypothetical protein